MNYSLRLARPLLSVLILILLIFVGCQRVEQLPASVESSDVQIALLPMPDEGMLVVVLTEADGAPVTDATVAVEGNMNHAGMIPVLADPIADDADGAADGRYHLPFTFTMFGDWIITVAVERADGSSFSRDLDVRASADGIEGDTVLPMDSAMPEDHAHVDHESSDHEDATDSHTTVMHLHDPMARPSPLAGGTGAVYFMLHNGGDTPVTLIGAESPAAAAVEIHTTENDNGVMRMRQLTDGIALAPDESVHLAPAGKHLMLIDLVAPLAEGDTISVTLSFEGADPLTFDVPVVSMDDLPAAGEMDHSH